jgi:hypothetical protein
LLVILRADLVGPKDLNRIRSTNELQENGASHPSEIMAGKLPARGCSAVVVAGLFRLRLLAEA